MQRQDETGEMTGRSPAPKRNGCDVKLVETVHPARIARRLDPRMTVATVERLRSTTRLRRRLAVLVVLPAPAMIAEDQDTSDPIVAELGRRLLPHEPLRLARMAGATWHARTLKLIVSGKSVAALVEAIGDEAYAFGLNTVDLAIAPGLDRGSGEAAAKVVEADGLRCLGLVLDRLSPQVRTEILLRLPPGTGAEGPGAETSAADAIAILTRVVGELDGTANSEDRADAA